MRTSVLTITNIELGQPHIVHHLCAAQLARLRERGGAAPLTPHRGISQDKLLLYLGFFQFVHNARHRGKALLGILIAGLVA
ncbi:MAG: hypothetical protein ACRYHQ_39945 [Janthinobacterium lividum]